MFEGIFGIDMDREFSFYSYVSYSLSFFLLACGVLDMARCTNMIYIGLCLVLTSLKRLI